MPQDGTPSAGSPGRIIEQAEFGMLMTELCFAVGAVVSVKNPRTGRMEQAPDISEAQLKIYLKAVADIPAAIVKGATELLAASTKYRGLPTAGNLRGACADVALGSRLTAGEAWEKVAFLVKRISNLDWDNSKKLIEEHSTPEIRAVVAGVGWMALQNMPSVDARKWFSFEWDKRGDAERQRLLIPGLWPGRLLLPAAERMKALPG